MGNFLTFFDSSIYYIFKKKKTKLPIESIFKLPSPLPSWPPGEGFASGSIDLGELEVREISTFDKVWATHEGGPDNLGASFFDPSSLQQGFFMLGCYTQPNNRLLSGWVLVASEKNEGGLIKPIDYVLVWSSESSKTKQDGIGYFWQPIPPDGYKTLGHVVTNSPDKPSLDKIRCVRSDLTDQSENDTWVWSSLDNGNNSFDVYGLRPSYRGSEAKGVCVGTFTSQTRVNPTNPTNVACLKNLNHDVVSSMPNMTQIEAIFRAYSPLIYFHPNEKYLPSSVEWYFANGALLYHKGDESKPVPIEPNGSNLPQGGPNDDEYWISLPLDEKSKERVKKGDLRNTQVYLHVKPMLGATFTDIAVWTFYPFNGPATAKVKFLNVPLGKIGEHVGDWEHLTIRVSNFNGELKSVYFSEHSKGNWVDVSEVEFVNDTNKVVGYASRNGHAMYSKPGLVLQGSGGIGIRNDSGKSDMVYDSGVYGNFVVVAAEYMVADGGGGGGVVYEPPWLGFSRKWGPRIEYSIGDELNKITKLLPGILKSEFKKFVSNLPNEVLGEEGPTGPKVKNNWIGDEA